jgi:hypothetical protein
MSRMISDCVATGKGISLELVGEVTGAIEAGRSQAVNKRQMINNENKIGLIFLVMVLSSKWSVSKFVIFPEPDDFLRIFEAF